MTREEAIHFAECLKHNWTIDFDDMEEFCEIVIKALQAPPISQRSMYQAGYKQGKEDTLKLAIAYADTHWDICFKSRSDARSEDE